MECDNCKKNIYIWQKYYQVGLKSIHIKCLGKVKNGQKNNRNIK